jgi:VanZ family protein
MNSKKAVRFLRRSLPILAAGGIFYLSHQPSPHVVPPLFPHQDKVLHAAEFFFLFLSMFLNRDILRTDSRLAWIFAIGVLYAASDEFHQSFVPGRDCSALDLLADIVGLAIGLVVCISYLRRHGRTG